jgi:uncharacterized protein YkwD
MKRLIIATLGVLLLIQATSGAITATTTSSYCVDAQEHEFLKLINQFRSAHGRRPLSMTQTLGAASDHHSTSMATYNYFSHDLTPEGITWSQNMANHGYDYNVYKGENIAAGRKTALAAFNQFKNSPTHRDVMLSGKFTAIGIGRAYKEGSTYGWYWTTDFGGKVDGKATIC